MIQLFYFPSPNGLKVAIMLEECGLPYEVHPVNIGRGEQFHPDYLRINPNNKIPAIVDTDEQLSIFESGAILQYLAEKSGRFLPATTARRYQVLSWLYWQVGGLGPMAGQAHHFRAFASEEVPYGIRRYTDEVNRLYGVMEGRLTQVEFLAGEYSIADMACWPWVAPHERQGQNLDDFPALKRWFRCVAERPAVHRAQALGREKMMDKEGYQYLYGQTADMVEEQSRRQADGEEE